MLHVPSMLTYGLLSFILAFFNKALFELANFRCSLFVIFSQLIFILLSFQILAYLRLLTLPILTRNDLYTLLIPSMFYCLSTVLSLQALMKLNVAIYVVIKRCTPALTFFLSAIVLKKQKLNIKTGVCVLTITIGAVLTSIGDVSYHFESYIIGGFSVIFHSLYLLTIQRYSEQKTSSDALYINSLLSLPMIFLFLLIFSNELTSMKSYQGYHTNQFWIYFFLSTIGGGLLNGSTFWCTIRNSALTTSIVGVLKSILQIFFGIFAFDRLILNDKIIFGIILSLIGGTMFSYLEYTNKQTTTTDNNDTKSAFNGGEEIQINNDKFSSILDVLMLMTTYFLLLIFLGNRSVICDKLCSREGSRLVREYFIEALIPIYEKNHLSIPSECIFSSERDIFYAQESNKIKITNEKWLCNYCNKTFHSEYHLDTHLSNRHNNTLIQNEQSVCLSEYCSVFRCDVLKRSIDSFNPLARGSDLTIKTFKKNVNEQQFIILRSRCASIINQCIPHNIHYDTRVKMQHEMYAEVCAYLTNNKYFELPNYRKSLVNFTSIFCLTIFIGICFLLIGFVRHSDWRFGHYDEDESEKHLSDEAISTATALLSKTPANGIIHSSKHSTSTIRHRVHFKSLDEC